MKPYFLYFIFLILHFYSYKKWSDGSDRFKTDKSERCFRLFFYLPLSILPFIISFVFINNILHQKFLETISWIDYSSFMIISLISFSTNYPKSNNIVHNKEKEKKRKNEEYQKG